MRLTVACVYRALEIHGYDFERLCATIRMTKLISLKIEPLPMAIETSVTIDVDVM